MTHKARPSCDLLLLLALLLVPLLSARAQQGLAPGPARLHRAVAPTGTLQEFAWTVLQKGISSGNVSRRSTAIAALSSIGPQPRVIRLILPMLDDKSAAVREKAVAVLDNLQVRSAVPRLRTALRDPSPSVSFTAAKALWDMGDASGRGILIAVLQGKRRGAPSAWQLQLQQTGQQLRSPMTLTLLGAQEAAGVFFGPAAVGVALVGQMLRDHGAPDRAFSAQLLGLDPSPQAGAALARAVHDKDWTVRASAAEALGIIRRSDSLMLLRKLLQDTKPPVRYMAAASVIRLLTPAPPASPTQEAVDR